MFTLHDVLPAAEADALVRLGNLWSPGDGWTQAGPNSFRLGPARPDGTMQTYVVIDGLETGLGPQHEPVVTERGTTAALYVEMPGVPIALSEDLGALRGLVSLRLTGEVTGSLPASLGNLTQLETLTILSGNLAGGLPASIGNMASLQALALVNLGLSGPLPDSLGNLSQLTQLYLGGNAFTGAIPASLGNLSALRDLDLSRNVLGGEIPAALGQLDRLLGLDLGQNQLTGPLPPELAGMASLQRLNLQYNDLSGALADPDWAGIRAALVANGTEVQDFWQRTPFGEVAALSGTGSAGVLRDGRSLTLEPGDRLFEGDVVSAVDAVLRITGPDGSRLTLGPGSSMALEVVNSGPFFPSLLRLREGVLNFQRDGEGQPLDFETPAGVIGVRGTSFELRHLPGDGPGRSELTVFSGAVEVRDRAGTERLVTAGSHVALDGDGLAVAAPTLPVLGRPGLGEVLALDLAAAGLPDGLPEGAVLHWLRDGLPIPGETGLAYTLAAADLGAIIGAALTWVDDAGLPRGAAGALDRAVVVNADLMFLWSIPLPQVLSTLHGIALTDLDRDGLPEVVPVRFSFPGGVELPLPVFEFSADGRSITDISAALLPGGLVSDFGREILVADINGDGWHDILIADHGFDAPPFPGALNRVYLSDGQGGLVDRSADFSRGPEFTHSLAAGDLTGDGLIEIFWGNLGVDTAYVSRLRPDGTVDLRALPLPYDDINMISASAMADLDGNGRAALIVGADQNIGPEDGNAVLTWNGSGFDILDLPAPQFHPDFITLDIAVLDLDGDGLKDLVMLYTAARPFYQGMFLQFLTQQADGSFVDTTADHIDPQLFNAPGSGGWGLWLHAVDLTGDGREDLVVEMKAPEAHRVLLRGEDGRFTPAGLPLAENRGQSFGFADITGDGRQEMLLFGPDRIDVWSTGAMVGPLLPPLPLRLDGGPGPDLIEGGAGDDTIRGWGGNDTLSGLAGDDLILGGAGDDLIFGGDGDDTLRGEDGNDTIVGGAGNDDLAGGAGDDLISGISGNNIIWGGFGNDTVNGGSGNDTIYGGGTGTNQLFGEDGDDLIFAGDGGDLIGGGHGNDTIRGGAGNDTIYGWFGDDNLAGGAGNDLIYASHGSNIVWGGLGNDTVWGGTGSDTIYGGGDGTNHLFGEAGNDLIFAGAGGDTINGGEGNDTIHGGAGNDSIGGGAGNDLIFGTAGANLIWGGHGDDTVQGGSGNDTIYGGGEGTNRLFGNDGNDLIFAGAGGDFIGGGAGNDTIRGAAGADTIHGGLGNDDLAGGAGDDIIFGSAGNNIIWGGLGNDTIHSGTGRDVMVGGPGADVFVFASAQHIGIGAGRDRIADFTPGLDRIDLSALNTQFNGTAGVLGGGMASFFHFAAGGLLIGDQTGNGAADWVLELPGVAALGAGDFIL